MGLVMLSSYFIEIIPKYLKWEPALLSLAFFSLNASLSSVSTPLTNALNAIGKIKITLYLMVFWTAATWILTPLAIVYYGFNGVAITSGVISFSVVLVVYLVKRYIKFNVFVVFYPLISTIIMGAFMYFVGPVLVKSIWSLLFMILLASMVYFLSILLFAKREIISNIKLIKENIKR